jgi:hypothetical protein
MLTLLLDLNIIFLFFTLRRGLHGLLFICNHLDFTAELVAVTVATSSTVLC